MTVLADLVAEPQELIRVSPKDSLELFIGSEAVLVVDGVNPVEQGANGSFLCMGGCHVGDEKIRDQLRPNS